MRFHTTIPIMINTNQTIERVLALLLLFVGVATSGCALRERIPSLLPNAVGHACHQASNTCGCDCAGVPCYGYHPTQWSHWPEWCESQAIPQTPTAMPEAVFPGEAVVAPADRQQEVAAPSGEPPITIAPLEDGPRFDGPPDEDEYTIPLPSNDLPNGPPSAR